MTTLQGKLTKIRAEIEALSAEREDIEDAPIPRAEAEARIAAVVNAPFSDTVIDPGGPNARVDVDPAPVGLLNGSFSGVELLRTLNRPSVLRAAFPEQIVLYLLSIYDAALGDAKPGLAADARRQRLAEIATQVFALEVEEEELITQLESQGTSILRRPEASAVAQLGLDPDAGEAA